MNGAHPHRTHALSDWRTPLLILAGMAVSVGLVTAVAPAFVNTNPGALVLVTVLAMSLARNRLSATWRGRAEAVILLPFTAIATAGVGYLILDVPVVGAAAFIVAISLSIWLRRFGPLWQRVGTLIALPFVTLLIAPGAGGQTGPWVAALLSVVALVVVVGLRVLAEVTHFIPRQAASGLGKPDAAAAAPQPPRRTSTLRPVASTRMAIQMASGLVAAVIVGVLLFPQHIPWVVLTAFIVASGNRGRADILYKSGLRILGAVAGSLAASLLVIAVPPSHPIASGPPFVVLLLLILGVGLWLRQWNYAAWALVVTLVITLLQGQVVTSAAGVGAAAAVTTGAFVWARVLAIVAGAICALAAGWFIVPVRSESVVRGRIADTLAALSEFVAENTGATDDRVNAELGRLDEIAPPWRASAAVTPWRDPLRKPGQWLELTHEAAHRIRRAESVPGPARRALGEARRSMREPEKIGPALLALNDALDDSRGDAAPR